MSESTPERASDGRAGSAGKVHSGFEGHRAVGGDTSDMVCPADALASVRRQMAQWRDVSDALRQELEREELDLAAIERLVERRESVYRRLVDAVGQMGAGAGAAFHQDAELCHLAVELVTCDRLIMERARARQQEVAGQLEELRRLRQGAAGYRRAAGRGQVAEPTFLDRCI